MLYSYREGISYGGSAPSGDSFNVSKKSGDPFNVPSRTIDLRRFAKTSHMLDDHPVLRPHQNTVYKYINQYHELLRGFMLSHEMGTGKTILAAFILDLLLKKYPNRKPILIAPKSLHKNFANTVDRYQEYLTSYTSADIEYITINSSKLYKNVIQAHATPEMKEVLKNQDIASADFLDNYVVIVDEAHNFFSRVANAKRIRKGAQTTIEEYTASERLYDLIVNSYDPKIVYMSGTPISNNVFEFGIAGNLLKGKVAGNMTLFPESPVDFMNFFMNDDGVGMKNMKEFASRIYGVCSFYGREYYDEETNKMFPESKDRLIYIPMSGEQALTYFKKGAELEELKMERDVGRQIEMERWEAEANRKYADADFRVSLRTYSNQVFPPGYVMSSKIFDDLKIYSPKINELMKSFSKKSEKRKTQEGKRKILIYSNFLETIECIKYCLDLLKIKYGSITGKDSGDTRAEHVDEFNNPDSDFDVLILSSAGAEGLDLKGVREIHIMEPHYNYNKIDQIKTRGIRYGSHIHLPKEEQNVEVFFYLSTFPKDANADNIAFQTNAPKKIIENMLNRPSVDVDLYTKSLQKMKTYSDLLDCIKKAAIDCYNYRNSNECINAKTITRALYRVGTSIDSSMSYAEASILDGDYIMKLYDKTKDAIFVYERIYNRLTKAFIYKPISYIVDGLVDTSETRMNEASFILDKLKKTGTDIHKPGSFSVLDKYDVLIYKVK